MFRYRLQRIILVAIICLVILHIVGQLIAVNLYPDNRVIVDIAGRFGLDDELSIPTWTSSIIAMMSAGLAWHIYNLKKLRNDKFIWAAVFLVGLLISVDEMASIHELILQGLHILADFGEGNQSLLANAWLLVLPLILIFVVISLVKLKKNLPKESFNNFAKSITIYLLGALVVETLSSGINKDLLSYKIGIVVLEEGLELIGLWYLLGSIMRHIETHEKDLHQRLIDIYKA